MHISICTGYIEEYTVIKCAEEVKNISTIKKGDHLIHCVTKNPYRPMFQSALVIDSSEDRNSVSVIRNCMNGIEEKTFAFSSIRFPYKVIYDSQAFPLFNSDDAIQRAKNRQRMRETKDHYCPLFNSSHHFVTWAKTGDEYSLRDIVQSELL